MSTEDRIQELITAQGITVKDIRSGMSGNPGNAAGNAAAIATTLTTAGFVASNILAGLLETDAKITGAIPATTDELSEGAVNQYYTEARADARVQAAIDDTVAAADSVFSSDHIETTFAAYSDFLLSLDTGVVGVYVTADVVVDSATDNIAVALGKLQGQINGTRTMISSALDLSLIHISEPTRPY